MRELEPALHVAESLPDTIKEEIIVVSNPWAGLLAELGAENMACLRAYVQKEQLGRFMEKLIKVSVAAFLVASCLNHPFVI